MLDKQIYPIFNPIKIMKHSGEVSTVTPGELLVVERGEGKVRTYLYGMEDKELIYLNFSSLVNLN